MPTPNYPIKTLSALLEGSSAKPLIVPSRLAPSVVYDVDYRSAIIALIFEVFSRPLSREHVTRRISAAKLKLLQFITVRPWLLPAIREWSEGLAQGSLDLTHSVRIRRGFLSDTAHDDLMHLLVASEIFVREGSFIVTGERVGYLSGIMDEIRREGLFEDERQMISHLTGLKLTNAMLEGW